MPEIKLRKLTKRWGKFYGVDNLNLDIEDNAFITLLGPSGCGKTTTLRMIAGLEEPTSGQITIGDRVVYDSENGINVPASKRKVGFLFQNYALWPNMTVYQNISFGLSNVKVIDENTGKERKLTKEEINTEVDRVSKIVKIGMFMDRYPAELSGGQQQRVAIARTLAPRPQVLFMDEPLSNLDAKLRLEMRYELQRLHLETGCTFVYVTHDQMEAMTLATKICLIDNGVLQQYAAPLEIYHRPVNLFVADFVGNPSINFLNADGKQDGENITLNILNNISCTFVSEKPLDLQEWYRKEEEQAALPNGRASDKTNKEEIFKCNISKVDSNIPDEITNPKFYLGIRPECIRMSQDGQLAGVVYGAMPTGMESTIKLAVGNYLLTSVEFGSTLFKIGENEKFNIIGQDILLFDATSGKMICAGSLRIN